MIFKKIKFSYPIHYFPIELVFEEKKFATFIEIIILSIIKNYENKNCTIENVINSEFDIYNDSLFNFALNSLINRKIIIIQSQTNIEKLTEHKLKNLIVSNEIDFINNPILIEKKICGSRIFVDSLLETKIVNKGKKYKDNQKQDNDFNYKYDVENFNTKLKIDESIKNDCRKIIETELNIKNIEFNLFSIDKKKLEYREYDITENVEMVSSEISLEFNELTSEIYIKSFDSKIEKIINDDVKLKNSIFLKMLEQYKKSGLEFLNTSANEIIDLKDVKDNLIFIDDINNLLLFAELIFINADYLNHKQETLNFKTNSNIIIYNSKMPNIYENIFDHEIYNIPVNLLQKNSDVAFFLIDNKKIDVFKIIEYSIDNNKTIKGFIKTPISESEIEQITFSFESIVNIAFKDFENNNFDNINYLFKFFNVKMIKKIIYKLILNYYEINFYNNLNKIKFINYLYLNKININLANEMFLSIYQKNFSFELFDVESLKQISNNLIELNLKLYDIKNVFEKIINLGHEEIINNLNDVQCLYILKLICDEVYQSEFKNDISEYAMFNLNIKLEKNINLIMQLCNFVKELNVNNIIKKNNFEDIYPELIKVFNLFSKTNDWSSILVFSKYLLSLANILNKFYNWFENNIYIPIKNKDKNEISMYQKKWLEYFDNLKFKNDKIDKIISDFNEINNVFLKFPIELKINIIIKKYKNISRDVLLIIENDLNGLYSLIYHVYTKWTEK